MEIKMDKINELLKSARTVAIVGISKDPEKPSYRVAEYLKNNGFRIIPVNPNYEEVLGEKCYKNLSEIPECIDIVDVFRKSTDILPIAEEAVKVKPRIFWMQLGIENKEARELLEKEGIFVVENTCLKIFHSNNRGSLK